MGSSRARGFVAHLLPVAVAVVMGVGDDGEIEFRDHVGPGESEFLVDAIDLSRVHDSAGSTSAESVSTDPYEYERAAACLDSSVRRPVTLGCPGGEVLVMECLDGTAALEPLWRRLAADPADPWIAIDWYSCPQDAPLLAAIEAEWASLTPGPVDASLQPDRDWVLATMPTIALGPTDPIVTNATLLGVPVQIRATPATYSWDWGDGDVTRTTDPGRPYPDQTVTHTYARHVDTTTVTLTVTWTGDYSVNGGPWQSFSDTVSSTAPGIDLDVVSRRTVLVDCDLNGNCDSDR